MITLNATEVVDQVCYGNWDDGDTTDNAPAPDTGESCGRDSSSTDTGVDSDDFQIYTTPTPGAVNDGEVVTYDLAISSTLGGNVTDPGEGTFTYNEGATVDLVATPDSGYEFDNWTGDKASFAEAIGDSTAANTTITMDNDYTIVAHFAASTAVHKGDFNGDGEIGPTDFGEFVSVYGTTY